MAIERTKCIYCKGLLTEQEDIQNECHAECKKEYDTFNTNRYSNLAINIDHFKDLEQRLDTPLFVFDEHTVNRSMSFYVVVKDNTFIEIGLKGLELGNIVPELTNYTDIECLDLSGSHFDNGTLNLEKLTKLKKLNIAECEQEDLFPAMRFPASLEELNVSGNDIYGIAEEVFASQNMHMRLIDFSGTYNGDLTDEMLNRLPPCDVLKIPNLLIIVTNLADFKKFPNLVIFENVTLHPNEIEDLQTYKVDYYGQRLLLKDAIMIDSIINELTGYLGIIDYEALRNDLLKNYEQEKSLNLSEFQLEILPEQIFSLSDFHTLDISKCYVTDDQDIPESCKFKTVIMRDSYLESIPDFIFKMKNLETLDISNNNIEYLDDQIFKLKKLRKLLIEPLFTLELQEGEVFDENTTVKYKNVELCLQEVFNLVKILKIQNNYINQSKKYGLQYTQRGIRELIGEPKDGKIVTLDLSGWEFYFFPTEVFSFKNLKKLYLVKSSIESLWYVGQTKLDLELPKNYENYTKLEMIDFTGVYIESFGEWLYSLKKLKSIYLSAMNCVQLPFSLSRMPSLETVGFKGGYSIEKVETTSNTNNQYQAKFPGNKFIDLEELEILVTLLNSSIKIRDESFRAEMLEMILGRVNIEASNNKIIEFTIDQSGLEYTEATDLPKEILELKHLKKLNLKQYHLWVKELDQWEGIIPKEYILDVGIPPDVILDKDMESEDVEVTYDAVYPEEIILLCSQSTKEEIVSLYTGRPFRMNSFPVLEALSNKEDLQIEIFSYGGRESDGGRILKSGERRIKDFEW